jgi:hypothetical protein
MITRVRKFIRGLVGRIKRHRSPFKTCIECGSVHLCGGA